MPRRAFHELLISRQEDFIMAATPRGLRHLALKTRDLEKTRRFYVDTLGLEEAFDHPGMIFLATPGDGDLMNFIVTRARIRPGGLDHFGFHVPARRWRALLLRLSRAGVAIRGRRGRSAIYIRDPNGYTVELYRD
jgi:catechol 2,3-dioxygenase-like lactoylglutathione lyase family enzyme